MRKLGKSVAYAYVGVRLVWKRGANFKIQVYCALVALLIGALLRLSGIEYAIIILTCAVVLSAEIFNTAFEEFCDKFQPTHDPHIARIKDLSAAAVLLLAIGAFFVGAIIFIPYFL